MANRLSQAIRRNKLLTLGLVGYFIGVGEAGYGLKSGNEIASSYFDGVRRVDQIDQRLSEPVSLKLEDLTGDYLIKLEERGELELVPQMLAERDSLKSTEGYEEREEEYREKWNLFNMHLLRGLGIGLLSLFPFGIGLWKLLDRRQEERQTAEEASVQTA